MKKRNALLSLYSKPGSEDFARELIKRGFNIISSGGTAKYLLEKGVAVTDLATITGFPPVLSHRVVTLAPQIHGPLLATPAMHPELEELGWGTIDLLYVTFYPLHDELEKRLTSFEACLDKTDIGGPTMVRSANKGGNVIVMTHHGEERKVLAWLDGGEQERENFLYRLRAESELRAAEYIALSAEVYQRFAGQHGYKGREDYPRYLMKVGEEHKFLPIHAAGVAFDSSYFQVAIGGFVLDRDGSVRAITKEERQRISDIADEHSANK